VPLFLAAQGAAAVPAAWPWPMQQTVFRADMWARWSEVMSMPVAREEFRQEILRVLGGYR